MEGMKPALPGVDNRRRDAMPMKKKRRRQQLHKVLYLTTYQRLEEYLRAFAHGHFHLLILVGAGGLAKSRSVRSVLDGKACWIEGNATPFGMYVKLYRHRDQFVVIDDVDAVYSDRSGVRLLKCLCQTEEEKTAAWYSDARSLERQGVPREFTTKSRVVIISMTYRANLAAQLGLDFTDKGLNEVGCRGSSFDGFQYKGRAQEMKVLERHEQMMTYKIFLNIVHTYEKEIRVVMESLFFAFPAKST